MDRAEGKAASEDEWIIIDEVKWADEESRTEVQAIKEDDVNQEIPTRDEDDAEAEDVERTETVPAVPIEVKAVVKEIVAAHKDMKTMEAKDDEANTDEDITEIETDTDNGEMIEVKIERTLTLDLSPSTGTAHDVSNLSTRSDTKSKRKKTNYRYWTYIIMISAVTPAAYSTCFRSKKGGITLLFYFPLLYLLLVYFPRYLKHSNYLRFQLFLIRHLGVLAAVLATVVLMDGISRTIFVFSGAAALFSVCAWTVVLLVTQFLCFSGAFSAATEL